MSRNPPTAHARTTYAIPLVEAAYTVTGDDRAWCRGVLAASRPGLDLGLGVQLLVVRADVQDRFVVDLDQTLDVPPELAAYTRAAIELQPRDGVLALLGDSGRYGSVSEFMTRMLPPEARGAVRSVLGGLGIRDGLSATFPDGLRGLVQLAASSRSHVRTFATQRTMWTRLLPHLATGWRLRSRLARGAAPEEAVLTPGGRVAHAVGPAPSRHARTALVHAVQRAETARGRLARRDPELALALWRGLVSGRWSIIDRIDNDGRRFLVAHANPPEVLDPRRLSAREDAVATLAVRGLSLKAIAYTLGLAPATAAAHLRSAMSKLGARTRGDLAALGQLDERLSLSELDPNLSAFAEPESGAALAGLGRQEARVAELAARGHSNAAIAATLGRSVRTVAHQLSAIFAKLGVGSRAELSVRLRDAR